MSPLDMVRSYAKTAVKMTPKDLRRAYGRGVKWSRALRKAERDGIVEFVGYQRVNFQPVAVYESKVIDLTATFSPEHWMMLAQNYLRFYIASGHANDGITIGDIDDFATGLGCPKIDDPSMWVFVLDNEGYEWADGCFRKPPPDCCDECKEVKP